MNLTHSILQSTASSILAAALSECLPGLVIQAAGETHGGFFCEFIFPKQPLSTDLLILLEERIRQIVRENRPIRVLEMVPVSAAELLKKSGQPARAAAVRQQEGLVSLVQIGSFVDWQEGEQLDHTGQAGVLRLLENKTLEKGRYRIFGMAGHSKKELKALVDRWKDFPEKNHLRIGSVRGYWEEIEGRVVWLSAGLELKRRWIDFWRANFSPLALEIEGGEASHPAIAKKRGVPSIMEFSLFEGADSEERGLLDEGETLALQVNSFGDPEKECISFLQAIHRCLTILGFTYRIRYSGRKRKGGSLERALQQLDWKVDEEGRSDEPTVEFLVEDSLQCEWVSAALKEPKQRGPSLSLIVWVERNLALLLEKGDRFPQIEGKQEMVQPGMNLNPTASDSRRKD